MHRAHFPKVTPSNCLAKRTQEKSHSWISISVDRTNQRADEQKVNLNLMGTDGDGVCEVHSGDGLSANPNTWFHSKSSVNVTANST